MNANKLYDVALTTYDFDLVILVATQTQKDPKEFLPYLTELKNMEDDFLRKYKIHSDLKQYNQALECLIGSGEKHFLLAVELINKHRLFKQALQLYKDTPELLTKVQDIFGEYLYSRSYYQESGAMFL